jgi:hypothetical protein
VPVPLAAVAAVAALVTAVISAGGCTEDRDTADSAPRTVGRAVPISVPSVESLACGSGEPACVDATVRAMQQRLEPLASACDHRAVFALTYLRVTEEFGRTIAGPDTFDDAQYVNRLDTLFAELYFQAFDAEARGDVAEVPPAWRIAFDQAAAGTVTGLGDALLGINAHINRDLPFAAEALGLVGPDGRSRRPDFDAVNAVLERVFASMIAEAADRFDPSLSSPAFGEGYGLAVDDALVLIRAWRDGAFRDAERLASAPTPGDRQRIVAEIEDGAASLARSLQLATAYPRDESAAGRDAYCASQRG